MSDKHQIADRLATLKKLSTIANCALLAIPLYPLGIVWWTAVNGMSPAILLAHSATVGAAYYAYLALNDAIEDSLDEIDKDLEEEGKRLGVEDQT